MFNPGDVIRVKENGLNGFVERWLKRIDCSVGFVLTYDIRWTHDQNRTCSYDFKTEWEAEQIWELESPQAAAKAWQNSQNMYRAGQGINFIPIEIKIGDVKTADCNHEWQEYTGLMISYKFCKKCDVKNENN